MLTFLFVVSGLRIFFMLFFFFFQLQDARGNDVDLSQYKGKVLLIVNVASQWYGFSAFDVYTVWFVILIMIEG